MPDKTKPTDKPVDPKTATFRAANPPPVPATGEALKRNEEKAAALEAQGDQQSGGALTFDAVVDSVVPTGNDRDTFTVVLRVDENDHKFFRNGRGRIELNDVRPEFGQQIQGKARATVTIAVTA